jgi:carbonic anhydrase/acetyltransferase-like protein (isoleucine patch superfamily)
MKALLICPAGKPAVPHLCASGPLATAPILGECLVSHWIEHLAGLGARQIQIVAADGADHVRAAVGDGARWGVRIDVVACIIEPTREEAASRFVPAGEPGWLPAPNDVVRMSHLPSCPEQPLFESYAAWFAALIAWMPRAITPTRIRVAEARPGVWINSRSHVSPAAKLIAPCWIGDQVFVAKGAVVGPNAILEDRAVAEEEARVAQSWVGPDTFVGSMTAVENSLAWGSSLIDWRTDSLLHVPDPFLLCSLAKPQAAVTTDRYGRALGSQAHSKSNSELIAALGARMKSARNQRAQG